MPENIPTKPAPIRAYHPGDREAVVRLHAELQAYEQQFRPQRARGQHVSDKQVTEYEAMLADEDEDAHLLVAHHDETLLGFVFFLAEQEILEAEPAQIYIQDIMVTADARRMGIGSALINAVRGLMAARGIDRIDLQVLVGNDSALAFYRAQGFETAYLGLKA